MEDEWLSGDMFETLHLADEDNVIAAALAVAGVPFEAGGAVVQ